MALIGPHQDHRPETLQNGVEKSVTWTVYVPLPSVDSEPVA